MAGGRSVFRHLRLHNPILPQKGWISAAAARDPGSHHFRGIDNPTIVERIRSWAPNSLLIYGWSFASHLRVLRAFHRKVNIMFRGDSTLVVDRGLRRRLTRGALLRWVYRHIDLALYAGTLNHAYFRAHGLREDQLLWAPHAVDNERFSAQSELRNLEARDWRRRLGIRDEELVFLLPAKLVTVKDPWTLLRAFTEVRRSTPEPGAHLVFVGDGDLAAALRGESAARSDVHFLGFQNQSRMPVVYRIADVVVLPSLSETWGQSINEGMACGRPAIVSDRVGCGKDLIRSGQTGFLFEHADPVSLQRAMTHFVRNPGRAAEMGREARGLIQSWTIEAYATVVADAAMLLSRS